MTQVRLLAAERGAIGVRGNGEDPYGVAQGSGTSTSGSGAERARFDGVDDADLGRCSTDLR